MASSVLLAMLALTQAPVLAMGSPGPAVNVNSETATPTKATAAPTSPVSANADDNPVAVALPISVLPADLLEPNPNLRLEGIPPISRALVDRVEAYTQFAGHQLADVHPLRRELLLVHRAAKANVPQLWRITSPGEAPEQLTDFPEPIRTGAFDRATGRSVLYLRDSGGNEATQVWRMDLDTRRHELLSSPDERSTFAQDDRGERILIASLPLDRTAQGGKRDAVSTRLTLIDAARSSEPAGRRMLAELPGGGWGDFVFSPDGTKLALTSYVSANHTTLWLIDVASGKREQLLPRPTTAPETAFYGEPLFSRDGKQIFVKTNEGSESLRLARFDLASGRLSPFGPTANWDVETFDLSADGATLALSLNVDGVDELHLLDAASSSELERPTIAPGGIGRLQWHRRLSGMLALGVQNVQSPGDVISVDGSKLTVSRWTSPVAAVDTREFATPQIVRWKSFDGRTISGILYLPPARFMGPRPVFITIHGGPEGQSSVSFQGRLNYLINEMGVAVLAPNVRGSSGYGRTFIDLDNGIKREDSVKDIGTLLDWIATDARLDADRVMVHGGSYGGYMVLASLVHFSDRLRGGVDIVGISDFVTFLNNTESYRRDLRRSEYGDERDPAIRAVLDKISPLANAGKIKAPLFVVHGRNDPRVPYTEAEQIVTRVRANGTPVWYLLADNEGHGFGRKLNADYLFYAMINFVQRRLIDR